MDSPHKLCELFGIMLMCCYIHTAYTYNVRSLKALAKNNTLVENICRDVQYATDITQGDMTQVL